MNKLLSNIIAKMKSQFIMYASWYLIIYAITMALIYFILFKYSVISADSGSFIYRIWGVVIFHFAITFRFKEDFDFLLILSNTRNHIFYILLATAIGFSAFFSGLIVIEKLTVDYFNNYFGYFNINDGLHNFAPYVTDNIFLTFLYFFVLCSCCSVFSLMMGSLFYRFGKRFTMVFWLVFSSMPAILLPAIFLPFYQSGKSMSIDTVPQFLRNFDLVASSGYMFVIAVIFGTAAYYNISRLPQR